jgi:peroxiredoxin
MHRTTFIGLTALAIACTLAVGPTLLPAASSSGGVTTGEAAPDFTLTDSQGVEHSLSDFEGKIVVLEWINKGCPFVAKFYDDGHMQSWQEQYTEGEVVWLTICSSAPGKQGHMSADEWQSYQSQTNMGSTAVLLDEDGRVGKAYGARTTPHMYVIDAEGTLRYQGAIDSKKSTKTADIDGATNYVAEAIEALQNGSDIATTDTQPYGCSVKY